MKKILVTSALPYVNNVPHIGTMVCVLSADVYSRFLRSKGENVIFTCGTDEHGTTAETKALEEGLTPQELTDKYFKIHKEVYEWFNCKFDCFGRTSSDANHSVTIDIFNKLHANGYIVEDEIEQSYCETCQKFLADRFVEGECPFCGYADARGDQCEKCSKLLNATELVEPRCKICGETPIVKKTEHLFIDLPKIAPELQKWMDSVKEKWSVNARTMTDSWMKEGLKLRSITRDLKWGIPVPLKGYEDKVFYSWFDAPIGYIGITKENRKDWEEWWHNPSDVKLVQFMGKDNIPFHTILFPAFCIGTKDNYTLLNTISVNEYLNYEGGMFSKSRGVGVFGDDAKETGIPADVWRYYILVNRPEKTDTEFSWNDFQEKNNNELLANLGNLVNRVVTFLNKYYDGKVPSANISEEDKKVLSEIRSAQQDVGILMEQIELKEALKKIMHVSKLANGYFQEQQPWKTIEENKERADTALNLLANMVKDIAILIEPFMPLTSTEINKQLNVEAGKWDDLGKSSIEKGHTIGEAKIIIEKIEDVNVYREKYAGTQGSKEETKVEGFASLNLKVGEIVSAEPHPDADKLLVLKVSIGSDTIQLVAGIKQHYEVESLGGKKIIVVTNLEHAKLRGVESQGMLLAAETKEGKLGLLTTEAESGVQVVVEGVSSNTETIKFDEFLKVELHVEAGKAYSSDKQLMAGNSEVLCDVEEGKVR